MKALFIISFYIFFFANPVFLFSQNPSSKNPKSKLQPTENVKAPVLIYPAQDQVVLDSSCTLLWSNTGSKYVYEVFISYDSNFKNGIRYSSFDTTFVCDKSKIKDAQIFWKVRTYKNKKQFSKWSDVSSFYFNMRPAVQENVIQVKPGGCHGDCSKCTHPCGRRPPPVDSYKE